MLVMKSMENEVYIRYPAGIAQFADFRRKHQLHDVSDVLDIPVLSAVL